MIYLTQEIKRELEKIVHELLGDSVSIHFDVGYADERFGDMSTNVLLKSGSHRDEIEPKILEKIAQNSLFKRIVRDTKIVHPGFINFYFKPTFFLEQLVSLLNGQAHKELFLKGKGKTVLVEYSSPNIAKRMHVGHIRSTIIGAALYNLFKIQGYTTIGDNHIGDWGTQFGQILVEYKKRFGDTIHDDLTLEELEELYVSFQKKVAEDPDLQEKARFEVLKLHKGDEVNRGLWKHFLDVSVAQLNQVYTKLGVEFDTQYGESFYEPYIQNVLDLAKEKGVAVMDQGALVSFCEGLAPLILQKQDGAYLYATTDLATLYFRQKEYRADLLLYVVSNEQSLYFEQLFCTAEKMGILDKGGASHVKFGTVVGSDGKKFSTRKGGAIVLNEVLDEAIKKAGDPVIGVAALKYNDLSQNRVKDIVFDWERMLSMEGDSAPYLMYAYARFQSILSKSEMSLEDVLRNKIISNFDDLESKANSLMDDLGSLPRLLLMYFDVIQEATESYHPNILANYLFALATEANHYYHAIPILKEEDLIKKDIYLLVSYSVSYILKDGMRILGINVLERI